jgi:hypothetical protein
MTKKDTSMKIKKTAAANKVRDVAHASETKQIREVANLTKQLLHKRYTDQDKKVLRGVHPKSHGCLNSTFTINHELDPSLQVGLFATPGKSYQAKIRFSNATGTVTDDITDGKNNSRGMAIKVLDVDSGGRFLSKDGGNRNQDFLMISGPAFAFANIPDYLRLNQVLVADNDKADAFFAPLQVPDKFTPEQVASATESFKIVTAIGLTPVDNPLEVQYFGAAPFRFGPDRVMHFSVAPAGPAIPQTQPVNPTPDYLKEALTATMAQPQAVVFDFMVQVRSNNETDLNLEDATRHWDENQFKFVKVATVTIPAPQVGTDSVESEENCEALVYTPWHALAAHEPLGGINRLRKMVYETSSSTRGACPRQNPAKKV